MERFDQKNMPQTWFHGHNNERGKSMPINGQSTTRNAWHKRLFLRVVCSKRPLNAFFEYFVWTRNFVQGERTPKANDHVAERGRWVLVSFHNTLALESTWWAEWTEWAKWGGERTVSPNHCAHHVSAWPDLRNNIWQLRFEFAQFLVKVPGTTISKLRINDERSPKNTNFSPL